MKSKKYKKYIDKQQQFFARTEYANSKKQRKKMRLKYYKPFLKKIGAIPKNSWSFQLNDWLIYPTTRLVMNRFDNDKQLKIDKFIESFLFPEEVSIKEISKDIDECPFDIEKKPKESDFYKNAKSKIGEKMFIYCCGCEKQVLATLVNGENIYNNKKLHKKLYYQCECGLYVGTHRKKHNIIQPLGYIPTKELRSARQHIHKLIDPLWQKKSISRSYLYYYISECLPHLKEKKYHTGEIKTIEEARKIYKICLKIKKHIKETNFGISKKGKLFYISKEGDLLTKKIKKSY